MFPKISIGDRKDSTIYSNNGNGEIEATSYLEKVLYGKNFHNKESLKTFNVTVTGNGNEKLRKFRDICKGGNNFDFCKTYVNKAMNFAYNNTCNIETVPKERVLSMSINKNFDLKAMNDKKILIRKEAKRSGSIDSLTQEQKSKK